MRGSLVDREILPSVMQEVHKLRLHAARFLRTGFTASSK